MYLILNKKTVLIQFWRKKRLKKAEQSVYIEQDKDTISSHDVKQKLAKEYMLLPLMRYEVHLDRKFERVLSVFYKLKELETLSNRQIAADEA